MTDEKVKACAQVATPSDEPGPFSRLVDQEWQALLEKDDRTSPEEYPDMALITRTELAGAMSEAFFAGTDADRSALQAERDKLSAEVERLTERYNMFCDESRHWNKEYHVQKRRAEDAEAKLTALVEANRDMRLLLSVALDALEPDTTEHFKERFCAEVRQALAHHSAPVGEAKPIPMLLFCPKCGVQHVDAPEFVSDPGGGNLGVAMKIAADREGAWTNPPHRSHLCHACGCIWRPADVPTEGVATITTRGSADNWTAPPSTPTSAPVEGAKLRPRAELLEHIDSLVAIGMKIGDGDGLQLLSALSEAAERIRADAQATPAEDVRELVAQAIAHLQPIAVLSAEEIASQTARVRWEVGAGLSAIASVAGFLQPQDNDQ